MYIGYARVSTVEQNLELQQDALQAAGCERIYSDKLTSVASNRPGLQDALAQLRSGDTLVVWKLDRLGRTVKGLVDLVEELQSKSVQFRSITDGIDTSTPAGRFFFHILAAMAQMERELIRERTQAGLAAARARGRQGGRRKRMTESKVCAAKTLLEAGTAPTEVARSLGVSRATLYRGLGPAT